MRTVHPNVVRFAQSISSETKNFDHVLPMPRHWGKANHSPQAKAWRNRHHIFKQWNIVPGDEVRLRSRKNPTIYNVESIDRFRNRVWLHPKAKAEEREPSDAGKHYHYSMCQLFLGMQDLPNKAGDLLPTRIFAKRVGHTAAKWNFEKRRFEWTRYAIATTPRIPKLAGQRLPIPWPKFTPEPRALPSPYLETLKGDVAWVSYKPPPFPRSLQEPLPRMPEEQDYFNSIYNPSFEVSYGDQQPPFEIYLTKELTNPHSRAKKVQRFKQSLERRENLRDELVEHELKHLEGRNKKEAIADARWKWRETLAMEAKENRVKRWIQRGADVKLDKKKKKQAKKLERKMRALTGFTLKPERHQYIPPGAQAN